MFRQDENDWTNQPPSRGKGEFNPIYQNSIQPYSLMTSPLQQNHRSKQHTVYAPTDPICHFDHPSVSHSNTQQSRPRTQADLKQRINPASIQTVAGKKNDYSYDQHTHLSRRPSCQIQASYTPQRDARDEFFEKRNKRAVPEYFENIASRDIMSQHQQGGIKIVPTIDPYSAGMRSGIETPHGKRIAYTDNYITDPILQRLNLTRYDHNLAMMNHKKPIFVETTNHSQVQTPRKHHVQQQAAIDRLAYNQHQQQMTFDDDGKENVSPPIEEGNDLSGNSQLDQIVKSHVPTIGATSVNARDNVNNDYEDADFESSLVSGKALNVNTHNNRDNFPIQRMSANLESADFESSSMSRPRTGKLQNHSNVNCKDSDIFNLHRNNNHQLLGDQSSRDPTISHRFMNGNQLSMLSEDIIRKKYPHLTDQKIKEIQTQQFKLPQNESQINLFSWDTGSKTRYGLTAESERRNQEQENYNEQYQYIAKSNR